MEHKVEKGGNMYQTLYAVTLLHKTMYQAIDLLLWADDEQEATERVLGTLVGPRCEYTWECTKAVCKDGEIIRKESLV